LVVASAGLNDSEQLSAGQYDDILNSPFALSEERTMGLTDVRLLVSNPLIPALSRELEFIVDSGAVYSVVPRKTLEALGITSDSTESFRLADLTRIERRIGEAAFTFEGKTRTSPVVFGEEGDAILLGAMTLEALGLLLDPLRRELRPMELRL
jgi:predicted aspartyl protease